MLFFFLSLQGSQKQRAGVTVCQQSNEGWNVYAKSVAATEPCPA